MQVDSEGVISGRYTNGVNKDLYQVPLYYFPSQYGLTHEGSNHFAASPDSGAAIEGTANDAASGLGSVRGNALEASNVDLAEEFVTMISTQRGFQANSKVITTTDHLLQTAANLKR
jgi:flagellar hook protein FlgE